MSMLWKSIFFPLKQLWEAAITVRTRVCREGKDLSSFMHWLHPENLPSESVICFQCKTAASKGSNPCFRQAVFQRKVACRRRMNVCTPVLIGTVILHDCFKALAPNLWSLDHRRFIRTWEVVCVVSRKKKITFYHFENRLPTAAASNKSSNPQINSCSVATSALES